MSQAVIVTTREDLATIVAQAVRRELGSILHEMAVSKPNESLSTQQAAQYLCQSPNTLRQWRSQGRGPAYEKRGHNIRYKQEDLDTWRNANRVLTGEALESLPVVQSSGQFLHAAGAFHA